MSGRELMDRLRVVAPAVPVIGMSGYALGGEAVESGRYLRKPFTAQTLLRLVREVLIAHASL
jgi:CheY-like chemotaxis protein